jgi:hypothetical protein
VNARRTYRIFRALGWLRWRILVNTITRSGARDLLERLSRTAESLLPLAIVVILVPAGVALFALGFHTGSLVGRGDGAAAAFPMQVVRWMLLASTVLTVMGPMLVSAGHQQAGMTRLLLLPIPARVLYASHTVGALAEPWVFLAIPMLLGLVAGAVMQRAVTTSLVVFLAGFAFLMVLLGIAAFASAMLQLLVRNRRRAELLVLVGMLAIVVVSMLPSALIPEDGGRRDRRPRSGPSLPEWVQPMAGTLPSELYVRTVRDVIPGATTSALARAGLLFAWAAAAHALTWPVYHRLLSTPASGGARSVSSRRRLFTVMPGLGPRTSAVAASYVRLGVRTPRGRTIVLIPIVLLAVFAALAYLRGSTLPFGPVRIGGGYSLGIFGITLALMSLAPFAFNQFAVDRSGLILQLLSPISTRELLYGKAVGGFLMAALPCAASVAAGLVTGGGSPWLWTAIILGALAAYITLSPVAAVLSLVFPRTVDLSSIGQASNAHQAAGLLGIFAFAAACVPPAALSVVGLHLLDSELATAGLLVAWTVIALFLARVGFLIAERLFVERKENLALVAAGR